MKAWMGFLALGIVVFATGGAMVILQWHHTIGLGVVGLGVIVVLGGLATSVRGRKGVSLNQTKAPAPRVQTGGTRNILIAVAVVVVIGVGTFYGTSYIAANQPSSNTSGSSSSTSSSASSGGTSSHTTSGVTSSTVSCIGEPNLTHCSTTGTSNSASQTSSTQSGQTSSSTSTTSTQSSQSGTSGYTIVFVGDPSVVPNGRNETLTGVYQNNGAGSIAVNIFIATYFSDGTVFSAGPLYYPDGPQVPAGGKLSFSDNMGPFTATGSYYVAFYAVDSLNQTISQTTTVAFTVT